LAQRRARQPLASTESQVPQFVPAIVKMAWRHRCYKDGSASELGKPPEALEDRG
jgi:hypothetical protein